MTNASMTACGDSPLMRDTLGAIRIERLFATETFFPMVVGFQLHRGLGSKQGLPQTADRALPTP